MFGTGNIVYADSCHFQFVGEGKKLTQEEALMNKTVDDKIKKREEK